MTACPSGWRMINTRCLQLMTDYHLVEKAALNNEVTPGGLVYSMAQTMCSSNGGTVTTIDMDTFQKLEMYLQLWRHDETTGNIWLAKTNGSPSCNIIKV